ncbi:MAG: hypothetical protein QMA97_02985 [Glaciecola sp.]
MNTGVLVRRKVLSHSSVMILNTATNIKIALNIPNSVNTTPQVTAM